MLALTETGKSVQEEHIAAEQAFNIKDIECVGHR